MVNGQVVNLLNQALWLVLSLSAPPILAAAAASLAVSVVQAATQVQEQTVQYAVKFAAVVITLALTGRLIGASLYAFADHIFWNFAAMTRP
jgi:type III secretion protein S